MRFIVALLIGVLSVTRASGEPEKSSLSPFKIRVNTDVFKKAFNSRDQEVLRTFKDTLITVSDDSKFSDLVVSLIPQKGEVKDFDFDLSIAKENVGATTNNLAFEGTGKYDGQDFTFKGPIDLFKMYYSLSTKFNHDHNYDALVFVE